MVSYLKDFYEFVTTDVAIISSQKSVKVLIIYTALIFLKIIITLDI